MTQSLIDNSHETVTLQRDGRFFPQVILYTPTDYPVARQLPATPPPQSLRHRLYEHLKPMLPWFSEQAPANRTDANRMYSASISLLRSFQNDVNRLLEVNCDANLQYIAARDRQWHEPYPPADATTYRHERSWLLSKSSIHWQPMTPVADAQLMSREISEVLPTMQQSVELELWRFVDSFEEGLAQLVDREVCGLVEWLPNACCRYHFFRVEIQQGEGAFLSPKSDESQTRSNTTTGPSSDDADDDDPWYSPDDESDHSPVFMYNQTFEVPYQVTQFRCEHELINSIRTSIGNTRVRVPENVQRVIATVPVWLYPFVEIIDGTLIRRRMIGQNTHSASTKHFLPVVEVREEHAPDPGLMIGSVILCGWGPDEIDAIERQEHEQATIWERRKSADYADVLQLSLLVLTLILGVTLLCLIYKAYIGAFYPFLLTGVSMAMGASLWQTIFLRVRRTASTSSQLPAYSFAAFGCLLLLAILSVVFHVPGASFLLTKLLGGMAAVAWFTGKLSS